MPSDESEGVSSDTVTRFGVNVNPRRPRAGMGPPASSLPIAGPKGRRNPIPADDPNPPSPPAIPTRGLMGPPPVPQRNTSESIHAAPRSTPDTPLSNQDWVDFCAHAASLCDEIDEYRRKYH